MAMKNIKKCFHLAFLSSDEVIMQFELISHDASSGEVDNGINYF